MKPLPVRAQRGMTLVELMVALTIGLFLTMGMSAIIVAALRQQKISASVNERDMSAVSALSQLDYYTRSAGSGFSSAWDMGFFGCTLRSAKANSTLIPSTLTAPFKSVVSLSSPVMAPLLVESGVGANGSDVLFVMGGNGGNANVPRLIALADASTLGFDNVIGLKSNDLLVVAGSGKRDCYVTQVASVTSSSGSGSGTNAIASSLILGGDYYVAEQDNAESLAGVANTSGAIVAPIGNTEAAYPTVSLLGVGSDDALYQYDMLHTRSNSPQAIADGVSHLFALYGVDTNGDGKVDTWVSPADAGWTVEEVKADAKKIRQIMAVRVAVISRSRGVSQAKVSPEKLRIFSGLGSAFEREISLTEAQRSQRYREMEIVIPVRNNLQIDS